MSVKNQKQNMRILSLIFMIVLVSGFVFSTEVNEYANKANETHFTIVLTNGSEYSFLKDDYPKNVVLNDLLPLKNLTKSRSGEMYKVMLYEKHYPLTRLTSIPTYPTASFLAGQWSSKAIGNYSAAIGYGVVSKAYSSIVIGKYNEIIGEDVAWIYGLERPQDFIDTDPIFQVGVGKDNDNRKDAITVLNNGNIGIHNSQPQEILDVNGNIKSTGTICDINGCIGSGEGGGSVISLWKENRQKLYYNDGSVGIGVFNPIEKLEVNGNIKANGSICDSNGCIGSGSGGTSSGEIDNLREFISVVETKVYELDDEIEEIDEKVSGDVSELEEDISDLKDDINEINDKMDSETIRLNHELELLRNDINNLKIKKDKEEKEEELKNKNVFARWFK